jgi:hypothetical protein
MGQIFNAQPTDLGLHLISATRCPHESITLVAAVLPIVQPNLMIKGIIAFPCKPGFAIAPSKALNDRNPDAKQP